MNKKIRNIIKISAVATGTTFAGLSVIAKIKKANSQYIYEPKQRNPLEGKKVIFVPDENDSENADGIRGHLEAIGESDYKPGIYEKYIFKFDEKHAVFA